MEVFDNAIGVSFQCFDPADTWYIENQRSTPYYYEIIYFASALNFMIFLNLSWNTFSRMNKWVDSDMYSH